VTPALEQLMKRAKTTVALLAAKGNGGAGDDVAVPLRRKTSPPPQGGLHASGRKVVRDSLPASKEIPPEAVPSPWKSKRTAIAASAIGLLAIGAFTIHKMAGPNDGATADASTQVAPAAAPAAPTTAEAPQTPPPSVLQPVTPTAPQPGSASFSTSGASESASNDVLDDGTDARPRHRVHVAPFSNGPVSHGTVLHIKMDGAIEKIEGDAQPTGFTVVIPGRRSLEPAAPLAARDGRIASIRVTNDGSGAELTVAFKDGVPNYLVRAKGDVLEMVLAPTGSLSAVAKPARATSAPPLRHHHHAR
jgi:hypothetical protein